MSQQSIINELICKSPQKVKCEECHKEFTFTFENDVYLNLMTMKMGLICPHCNQEHTIGLTINMEKSK